MSHNPSARDPFVARMPLRNQGTSRLAAALGQRAKAALHHWQWRRMNRTLQQLDDRTLDDIGLPRNEIGGLVNELVGPPPPPALQGQNGRSSVRRDGAQERATNQLCQFGTILNGLYIAPSDQRVSWNARRRTRGVRRSGGPMTSSKLTALRSNAT